jgi:hypothetical protein
MAARLKVVKPGGQVEWYRLVILRVTETDLEKEVGGQPLPREFRLIDDDEVAEITGGDKFVTAFVPESVFGPGK